MGVYFNCVAYYGNNIA